MRFSVLASSSRGNATILEAGGLRLLIDIGLSNKALVKALAEAAIDPDSLDGILITHEHTDHVKGLSIFTEDHPTPVYANYNTAAAIDYQCRKERAHVPEFSCFESNVPFALGELTITPLQIPHDTAEPVGFVLHDGTHQLGYFTDLGYVPETVAAAITQCDALVLESNYDPQMLHNSGRPYHLITRIQGRAGHLSNEQACEAIAASIGPNLKSLTLAHLSPDCNQPHLAEAMMKGTLKHIGRTDVALTLGKHLAAIPFITL